MLHALKKGRKMRPIKYIIVHCSATPPSVDFTVEKLRRCHVTDNGWIDIGYHFYVTRDGRIHHCRPVELAGAHCHGFNQTSIGICYEGGVDESLVPCDTRTPAQRHALRVLLLALRSAYPTARICGHRDLNGGRKACPCFDATKEYCRI